jgi:hypothetical protein
MNITKLIDYYIKMLQKFLTKKRKIDNLPFIEVDVDHA